MLLMFLLCLLLVALDQLFKYLAVLYLMPVGASGLIPGFIEFLYVENTGAAFGMLSDKTWILTVVTSVALLALAVFLVVRRPKDKLELVSLLMIFSGGVGNLIDRIANGYVVDYLNFTFMRFAVFNFADILVTCGFVVLIFAVARAEWKNYKKQKALAGSPDIDVSADTDGQTIDSGIAISEALPDDSMEAPQKQDGDGKGEDGAD